MASDTESVVDYTIDAIRSGIRQGRFVPGQRLVVADLTAALKVSAGPVREAIRRLTGDGLIDIVPHRGAIVRKLNSRDVAEIYEVREAVEGLAAELAARNIDKGDNRVLLEAERDRADVAVRTGVTAYIEHNWALHQLIFRIAGNERLFATSEQLKMPIYRYQQLMDAAHIATSRAEHDPLIAAILAGDEKKAGNAMRRHIRKSAEAMLDVNP
jgi:DNA-binding GntR family transcriptional regulator